MNDKSNIQWLDSLRTLATICVILMHVTSPLVNMTFGKNWPYWWIGILVNSAGRFAVPLFLMLSGATLLNKDYPIKEYYKKRFMRVLLPFPFWMVVYWIFRWSMLTPSQQPKSISSISIWAKELFLNEGISKHFWYIYMIVFIYIFIPFLGKLLRAVKDNTILLIIILWLFINYALRNTPFNYYNWSGDYGNKLLAYVLSSGYLVVGYYLIRINLDVKKVRFPAIITYFITIATAATATYYFSKSAHKLDLSIYSTLSINTIIQTTAVFLMLKEFQSNNKIYAWLTSTISNYSYGIYLVHIIIIGVLFRNGIYWSFAHPIISLILLTLIVLFCSFSIIFGLRKIPFGKFISG